jgi:hypothetical protein
MSKLLISIQVSCTRDWKTKFPKKVLTSGLSAVCDKMLGLILGRNLDYFRAILGILWKNRKILGINNG